MRAGALPEYRAGLAVGAGMTRQWTREALKAAGWEWMADAMDVRATRHRARSQEPHNGSNVARDRAGRLAGKASEAAECAAMLRRGTVEP
jgi:hypothetical protein